MILFADFIIKIAESPLPVCLKVCSSSVNPRTLPSDPFFQEVCSRIKKIHSPALKEGSKQESSRESPDGKENTPNTTTLSLGSNLSATSPTLETPYAETLFASSVKASSIATRSQLKAVISSPQTHQRDIDTNSTDFLNNPVSNSSGIAQSSNVSFKKQNMFSGGKKKIVNNSLSISNKIEDSAAAMKIVSHHLPLFKPPLLRHSLTARKRGMQS